jgi:hypothetical protein
VSRELGRALALAGALAVTGLPAPASADDEAPPGPPTIGDRVRVSLHDRTAVTGSLLTWDARSLGVRLVVDSDSAIAARRIPRDAIAGIEIGRTHHHSGRGALLGMFAGLLAGIVIAGEIDSGSDEYASLRKAGWILGGPFWGFLGGAMAGGLVRHETWHPRPLPAANPAAADSLGGD